MLAERRDLALKLYEVDLSKVRTEGFQEGQAALLLRLLAAKFGPLPPSLVERTRCATESELLR